MSDTKNEKAPVISIPVAAGELFDKITILEIKQAMISRAEQLENVRQELALLMKVRNAHVNETPDLLALEHALKNVNQKLWQVEDDIREHEHRQQFDDSFIALARSVYQLNDRRADLKRQISLYLGSTILEEKSYA